MVLDVQDVLRTVVKAKQPLTTGRSQYSSSSFFFTLLQKKRPEALLFTTILQGTAIISSQLSDSDTQLTTTCLWPVIRACLPDSPFAYLSVF